MSGRAESARCRCEANSGMQFPQEPSVKEKDPFAEVLVNSRWRGRESRPRSARADRCGTCRLELRWQTLTRLLSSAPSRGSIPRGGHIKRKGPLCRGPSQFKVAGKGIEPLTRGFQSSALPTELPSHLRCALFQGLISITKDTLRSTENFKKIFERDIGHDLAAVERLSEVSTGRKKFFTQGRTGKLTWRHSFSRRRSTNRFLHP